MTGSHIDTIYQVPEDIWKDFQRITRGNGPLHEWWKYVSKAIEMRTAAMMYAESWRARY
jgi:hypothetical protein